MARFGQRDVERLLGDAGIVRHRGKIEAAIANAHGTIALRATETPLPELMWSYRDRDEAGAKELSKKLKAAGFRFVGPTTVYAAMEACGIVDNHRPDCWVREAEPALVGVLPLEPIEDGPNALVEHARPRREPSSRGRGC